MRVFCLSHPASTAPLFFPFLALLTFSLSPTSPSTTSASPPSPLCLAAFLAPPSISSLPLFPFSSAAPPALPPFFPSSFSSSVAGNIPPAAFCRKVSATFCAHLRHSAAHLFVPLITLNLICLIISILQYTPDSFTSGTAFAIRKARDQLPGQGATNHQRNNESKRKTQTI